MTDGHTDGGWVASLNQMVNYTAPDDSFARFISNYGITVLPLGVGTDYSMDEFRTMTLGETS